MFTIIPFKSKYICRICNPIFTLVYIVGDIRIINYLFLFVIFFFFLSFIICSSSSFFFRYNLIICIILVCIISIFLYYIFFCVQSKKWSHHHTWHIYNIITSSFFSPRKFILLYAINYVQC